MPCDFGVEYGDEIVAVGALSLERASLNGTLEPAFAGPVNFAQNFDMGGVVRCPCEDILCHYSEGIPAGYIRGMR